MQKEKKHLVRDMTTCMSFSPDVLSRRMWSPIFFAAAAALIATTSWLLVSLLWRWWWRNAARRHDVARRTFLATAFGTATEETTIPVPLPDSGGTTIHVPLIRLAAPPLPHNAPPPPPVLFVHGIGSSAAMVLSSPAAQALRAQHHDLYAMDMPGLVGVVSSSSSSSSADNAFVAMSADECLAAYAAVFDQVLGHIIASAAAASAPIIVAHSLGAFLVSETFLGRRCCGRRRHKPSGLVLVSPAGVLPTLGPFGPLWALFFRLGLPGAVLRPIAQLWLLFFFQPTATGMSRTQYWWHVQAAAPRANVAAKFMAFAAAAGGVVWTRPQLANILRKSLPVALIWGSADALAPMSSATMQTLFAAAANQEKVTVMPGVGHSALQHPDSAPVLRSAVARLVAAAAAAVATNNNYNNNNQFSSPCSSSCSSASSSAEVTAAPPPPS